MRQAAEDTDELASDCERYAWLDLFTHEIVRRSTEGLWRTGSNPKRTSPGFGVGICGEPTQSRSPKGSGVDRYVALHFGAMSRMAARILSVHTGVLASGFKSKRGRRLIVYQIPQDGARRRQHSATPDPVQCPRPTAGRH